MARRHTRSDSFVNKPRLLEAMGVCRHAITSEMSQMTINGVLYYSASTVVAAIDGLAHLLTG